MGISKHDWPTRPLQDLTFGLWYNWHRSVAASRSATCATQAVNMTVSSTAHPENVFISPMDRTFASGHCWPSLAAGRCSEQLITVIICPASDQRLWNLSTPWASIGQLSCLVGTCENWSICLITHAVRKIFQIFHDSEIYGPLQSRDNTRETTNSKAN